MNDVVNYIEDHITARLTVEELSLRFAYSEYHFSRLFRIFAGKSIKQYILGRKLAYACDLLRNSSAAVIVISYDLGFEYPEVFSRAFKHQYGISPSTYRRKAPEVKLQPKASIVERSILNYKGNLALDETYLYIDHLNLLGTPVQVYEGDKQFGQILHTTCESFLNATKQSEDLEQECFYAVVNCHGENSDLYTVFYGKRSMADPDSSHLETRTIPSGWYACFNYYGNMLDMVSTFLEDMYRWIMLKEIELCPNGIGMINLFDSQDSNKVRILVPIHKPK